MLYRALEWDQETQKTRKLAESSQYEEIWDIWAEQPDRRIMTCKAHTGEIKDGKFAWYLVTEGRKPGIYDSYSLAEAQTNGIVGKPIGYLRGNQQQLVQDWFRGSISRREGRDVEIVRKSCGCCWYCGKTLVTHYGKYLGKGQRDHQVSRANNGANDVGNLVLSCERCNTAEKNSLSLEDYRTKLLEAKPQDYPDGGVVFFGERSCGDRHAWKIAREPNWCCPGTAEIPCLPGGK